MEATPFDASLDPASFFVGSPQEEALARLEWLVEHRHRLGLIVAADGLGKSHLSAMAVRRLGGLGAEAALLPLRGIASEDWLEMLLDRLPLDPASRAEPRRAWQKLDDRLRENTLMERTTAIVFDDIDHAAPEAIEGIVRLISSPEPRHARLLVVATVQPDGLARLPDPLVRRAMVRIELEPWTAAEVAGFLDDAIRRTGGGVATFSHDAAVTVARLSGGVPRVVCQLAGLSVAAAAGDGLRRVDAATVERSWRELSAAASMKPAAKHAPSARRAVPEGPPQVRVVRRLWG